MLHSGDFIKEEFDNVTRSLQETLRNQYGTLRSIKFYEECLFRLDVLRREFEIEKSNSRALEDFAWRLSHLSELIARIERSHLGEFSWPFANALERLAISTCHSSPSVDSANECPLFFISSEGGLCSYRIYPEQEETDIVGRRIYNIVFPRTLKHHVLLHPILGHELGHAAWTVPDLQEKLNNVLHVLFANSSIASANEIQSWMKKHFSFDISIKNAADILTNWKEEFLCDLFGLVLMGPSFVAAHRSLLSTIEPNGDRLSANHPPNLCRYMMLDMAVDILGWSACSAELNKDAKIAVTNFWTAIRKIPGSYPEWATVFSKDQIGQAVTELSKLIDNNNQSSFTHPSASELNELVSTTCSAVPPSIKSVDDKRNITPRASDFRSILYAGWLAWHREDLRDKNIGFFEINRLCDRAILYQEAINLWCTGADGDIL